MNQPVKYEASARQNLQDFLRSSVVGGPAANKADVFGALSGVATNTPLLFTALVIKVVQLATSMPEDVHVLPSAGHGEGTMAVVVGAETLAFVRFSLEVGDTLTYDAYLHLTEKAKELLAI